MAGRTTIPPTIPPDHMRRTVRLGLIRTTTTTKTAITGAEALRTRIMALKPRVVALRMRVLTAEMKAINGNS